jgi:hypothetical protein
MKVQFHTEGQFHVSNISGWSVQGEELIATNDKKIRKQYLKN